MVINKIYKNKSVSKKLYYILYDDIFMRILKTEKNNTYTKIMFSSI